MQLAGDGVVGFFLFRLAALHNRMPVGKNINSADQVPNPFGENGKRHRKGYAGHGEGLPLECGLSYILDSN